MSTQQIFQAASGNMAIASNWSGGFLPTADDDIAIGDLSASDAQLINTQVFVNSLAVSAGSTLDMNSSVLVATDGSVTSPGDTDVVVTGNHGTIDIGDGSNLYLGSSFLNDGVINETGLGNLTFTAPTLEGDFILSGSGTINAVNAIELDSSLTLSGGGSINLGNNSQQGFIDDGETVANVNYTISGAGQIQAVSFDNQAGGTINAGLAVGAGDSGDFMLIQSGDSNEESVIGNEGVINVLADAALVLQSDNSAGGALVNAGEINVAGDAGLQIADDFTFSGSGSIDLNGVGAFVGSDGAKQQTLINEGSIFGKAAQTFVGANSVNGDLMKLVNQGTIEAFASGNELTVATGANVVQDAGGLLEASTFAHLVIDSAVATGASAVGLAGGTIESTFGGVVTIASSVSAGSPSGASPGQVVIDTGTVEFLTGSSDSVPIEFDGGGGTLEVHSAATVLGAIGGFVSGDALLLTGDALTSVAIGTSSLDVVTNSGNFDFASVAFSGPVTGYVGSASKSASGMELVQFNDGNVVPLFGSDTTFFQGAADTSVDGEGDTIDFQGAAANTTEIAGTAGEADVVNGSGGAITLNGAQARIVGGADAITFLGTSQGTLLNTASLFSTAGHFDTVTGADGEVLLNGAQASVIGAGNTIRFVSGTTGNQVSLQAGAGLSDTVEGSAGVVDVHSSTAIVAGGGDAIDFISGASNVATLKVTGSNADLIQGVAGTVNLDVATANATSNGDTFTFEGANTLGLVGTGETMAFSHGIGGLDSISGVGATDSFQFSSADFANFAALLAHTTQSGPDDANTVISLSASDAVTLVGVQESSLSASQFKFV